jgi:hypothetical protein
MRSKVRLGDQTDDVLDLLARDAGIGLKGEKC